MKYEFFDFLIDRTPSICDVIVLRQTFWNWVVSSKSKLLFVDLYIFNSVYEHKVFLPLLRSLVHSFVYQM